ncbi:hypothetical protein D9756_006547 [Leucocoprinus leucothites]|uniref:Uncharacterized protein n=1 Tax=Leucocoprinus leucothites TaxID=201217 RepID=A0A8H5LHA4_9AGAR|nr:hypothetical protein D9756_006547 [Leucoagaricus leucothites]
MSNDPLSPPAYSPVATAEHTGSFGRENAQSPESLVLPVQASSSKSMAEAASPAPQTQLRSQPQTSIRQFSSVPSTPSPAPAPSFPQMHAPPRNYDTPIVEGAYGMRETHPVAPKSSAPGMGHDGLGA